MIEGQAAAVTGPSTDLWTVMSTARTIRRFTDEPVDDATLARCLEAATWAPSGANAQQWRFVVLRSAESRAVVATAAARALEVIESAYRMTRPAQNDDSRRARTNRATYELHDRADAFTSVLFLQERFPQASELLLGGSIFPAMQNFLLAARALGLGACLTSWASYGGEPLLRAAVGVPDNWSSLGTPLWAGPEGGMDRSVAGLFPTSCSSIAGKHRQPQSSAPLQNRRLANCPQEGWLLCLRTPPADYDPTFAVVVPGISFPQNGFAETGTKPFFLACIIHVHSCAGSCPKSVEKLIEVGKRPLTL